MQAFVYIDGQIVPKEEAKISIFDLSVCRGYAIFDFMRTYQKRPFRLANHLERFVASAKTIDLPMPLSKDEIAAVIDQLLAHAPYSEANIKIFLTGGESNDQYAPEGHPKFFALVYPIKSFPEAMYSQGIKLISEMYERPYPSCKSTHYLTSIVASRRAQRRGADDVLFLNHRHEILETGSANFFGIKKGVVITSKEGIIAGITRQVVLELLEAKHVPCEVRSITDQEIDAFDGAFITSSSKEIVPVVQIDQKKLLLHPLIGQLTHHFRSYTQEESKTSQSKCVARGRE